MSAIYSENPIEINHAPVNDEQKNLLLSFCYQTASVRTKEELGTIMNERLRKVCQLKNYLISVVDEEEQTHGGFLYNLHIHYSRQKEFKTALAVKFALEDGLADKVLEAADPVIFDVYQVLRKRNAPDYVKLWRSLSIEKIVGVALRVGSKNVGILWIEPEWESDCRALMSHFFKGICSQLAVALSNTLANEKIALQLNEIQRYKQQLEEEKNYLQQQIETVFNHSEIIGSGPEMQKVFRKIEQVAYSHTSVLLLGETGTGKELIARAIHDASPRRDQLMIKVNCAALPANLIESELFGHERGSFTGATDKRIGKFELAHNSTLFLDEIGEMPPDLQVKLLRALQEREIERIGGKSTIKVNIRIIAATNRNLLKEVAEGRFRSDLYYRLNVFPITLPALRERKEDIPVLAAHFMTKFSKSLGKKVSCFSKKAEQEFGVYHWPGNVRELEHLMERCVLTSDGNTIKELGLFPALTKQETVPSPQNTPVKTLDQNERDYILQVLKMCKGKISGPFGAAALLGVPTSTLNSRIARLKIVKNGYGFNV